MKLRDTLTHLTYVIGDDTTISDKHQLCDVRVCVREQNRLPNDSCKLYSSEQTKYTPTILIIISHSTKSNRKKERSWWRRRARRRRRQSSSSSKKDEMKTSSTTTKIKAKQPNESDSGAEISRAPHVYNNSWISRLHKQQLILFTFLFISSCICLPPSPPPSPSSYACSSLFFHSKFVCVSVFVCSVQFPEQARKSCL